MDSVFGGNDGTIPTKENFSQTVARIQEKNFYHLGQQLFETVMRSLRKRHEVSGKIHQYAELARKCHSYDQGRFDEYEKLLLEILPYDFLKLYKVEELEDCNRYMDGLLVRVERAHINPAKDANKAVQLIPHLNNLEALKKRRDELSQEGLEQLKLYQKMIQEFRISLFAPEIKTRMTVSAKKLKEQFQKIT